MASPDVPTCFQAPSSAALRIHFPRRQSPSPAATSPRACGFVLSCFTVPQTSTAPSLSSSIRQRCDAKFTQGLAKAVSLRYPLAQRTSKSSAPSHHPSPSHQPTKFSVVVMHQAGTATATVSATLRVERATVIPRMPLVSGVLPPAPSVRPSTTAPTAEPCAQEL